MLIIVFSYMHTKLNPVNDLHIRLRTINPHFMAGFTGFYSVYLTVACFFFSVQGSQFETAI